MTIGTINNNLYENAFRSKQQKILSPHTQNLKNSNPFELLVNNCSSSTSSSSKDSLSLFEPNITVKSSSSYLRQTQYNDFETNEAIPVNIHYITNYSDEGISCVKYKEIGSKKESKELWSIKYENAGDCDRVNDFLNSFTENDTLTFASQKDFWIDFLNDKIDIADFKNYYYSTNNGIIDFTEAKNEGKSLRETTETSYARYINNQSFIGHVYSENDLQPSWYKNGKVEFETVFDPNVPKTTSITSSTSVSKDIKESSLPINTIEWKKTYLQNILQKYARQNTTLMDTQKENTNKE